jgi:hypothetical protein
VAQTGGRSLQVFTDRELQSLQEQLFLEELAVHKMRSYEGQLTDPELQKVVTSLREKHEGHYNTLMRHLLSQEIQP